MLRYLFVSLPIALALAGAARAGDAAKGSSSDPAFSLSGDIGLMNITSDELVYDGGRRLSQLVWKSRNIQVFTGTLKIDLPQQWRLTAIGQVGMNGNGHMTDYDWLAPWAAGTGDKQWSDRSQHPDTRLDHFYTANVELGRDIAVFNDTTAGMGIGFKYTDVKWSAWGGSYVYSAGGVRNYRGKFPADEKGISFRQSLPVPYIGINLNHTSGPWSFSGALQGGLAVGAYDIDDHWVRSLRFYDYYNTAPVIAIKASAEYAFRPATSFYLAASLDKMFTVGADTKAVDTISGAKYRFPDGAGGNFQSMAISFGIRGRF